MQITHSASLEFVVTCCSLIESINLGAKVDVGAESAVFEEALDDPAV
jgi:hypothetical protein